MDGRIRANRQRAQQFFCISCPIDYVHRLRLKQEIEFNEIQDMQYSIFTNRIGFTYLSGAGRKQRFLRVGEMHIYLVVNLSIKHILHNLRNVFYPSFCNFSKANPCYLCNFSKYFIFS